MGSQVQPFPQHSDPKRDNPHFSAGRGIDVVRLNKFLKAKEVAAFSKVLCGTCHVRHLIGLLRLIHLAQQISYSANQKIN